MATRWDKLRSATLDAPARQEVARLIRDERSREPVVERAGTVVEFRRGGQLMCGYLQCPPRGLLRVVGVDGRLRRLRRDKIVDVSRDLVALWPGEEALRNLQRIDAAREQARLAVDLETLWTVVVEADAERAWSLDELRELHDTDPGHTARRVGLLRALWQGDYFDRDGGDWRPRTTEAVQQSSAVAGRESAAQARQAELARWLRAVADGGDVEPRPQDADHAVALLERAAVGEETPASSALMQAAHMHGVVSAFEVLVRLGRWSTDENLELHRLGVPDEFSESILDAAQQTDADEAIAGWSGSRRWGGGTYASVGGERAYRLRRSLRGRCVVDIHLAVPALLVAQGGEIDTDAAERGAALRLVERDIPMLPKQIVQACRLTPAAVRPALTLTVRLDEGLHPCHVKLKRSRVRPQVALDDTDVGETSAMRRLFNLAAQLRQRRRLAGAWEEMRPAPWTRRRGARVDPVAETPADFIDTELRLLAAEALGHHCHDQGVEAIYMARELGVIDDVKADLVTDIEADAEAVRAYRMEGRVLNMTLGSKPAPHPGLGLSLCAAGVEPMRRYVDLVMQRQLLAMLQAGTLPPATLERAVLETHAAREAAQRVEASSQRYWSLKWLEQPGHEEGISCVVVEPRGPGYLVLLEGGPAGAFAPANRGQRVEAAPGQRLRLRIEQVSARRNVLRLADARLDNPRKTPDPDPPGRC